MHNSKGERIHYLTGESSKAQVQSLYRVKADEKFIPDVVAISRELADLAAQHYERHPDLATGLTRGGIAVLEGMASIFEDTTAELTFAGEWRDRVDKNLPETIVRRPRELALLAIGDLIVASGNSLVEVLSQMEALVSSGIKNIAVVAPIITELGATRVLEAFPQAHIFTAFMDPDTKWVTFSGKDGNPGKKVLFVGQGLGDAGDMTIESAAELLKRDSAAFQDTTVLRILSHLK